ncbi:MULTISPECIES: peptide deformylase [unclassified Curtobacterium]|uniref:peptide deformylase n=1 Tax=unclassified Curtobacterium TaxID=257496 RepID=UPI000DA7A5BA|nr:MULTISPECIES: peptide deformylase [unclassified Curtobacterium]PZE30004.1 peptide deformylase [Curtobacterium sp. MCBD17_028]PZF61054.1 peptide deformylase [Curtobacterium sp. MCBD17_034]PZF66215.1 peptide deformylase [Curtobacterium sp. MCBD17_013]PZM40404.1 peptide deformylase [Curtobacterium sp. MCBD17_031]WIB64758.1 peptide deformylase [Curtobacterium sp. MCBD17_040]
MTVRPIRLFGDPVLRSPADPVRIGADGVADLVQDLLDTVRVPGRAGVAAPQIGVGLRAFSVNVDGFVGYVLNPELVETRGEPELMDEGCLSVPGLAYPTRRFPYARVRGLDVDGAEVVLEGEGLMAEALQHETDHLDGTVYVMTLDPETRRRALRDIRGQDWF